jgi:hypothetical protein
MMKSLIKAALISCALVAPVFAVAQTATPDNDGSVTRAQVRADLIRVEQAGYRPSAGDDAFYPNDIQAAEAKVNASKTAPVAGPAVGGDGILHSSASTSSGVE